MSGDQPQSAESVPVTLARLEGKLDAALATHSATLAEHGRRLDVQDTRLNEHAKSIDEHAVKLAALPAPAPRTTGIQIAALVISAIVGLGALAGLALTLMQIVARVPAP